MPVTKLCTQKIGISLHFQLATMGILLFIIWGFRLIDIVGGKGNWF